MTPVPPCPKCEIKTSRGLTLDAGDAGGDVDDAIEQCERIIEMCGEVPERGEDFAASVQAGVEEVLETIRRTRHVTDKQQEALDNWESGVGRWLDH